MPRRDRPRLAARRPADDLVWNALARRLSPARARLGRVVAVWHDLAPPSLARAVSPGRIRGQTLTLYARHAQWIHEVRYLEAELLEGLRRVRPPLGIERIDVRLAPADAVVFEPPPVSYAAAGRRAPTPARAADAEMPPEVRRALDEAPDDETRAALLGAFRALSRDR